MSNNYIQNPDGKLAGSVGLGRDHIPTPAVVSPPPQEETPEHISDLVSALANLPGITVSDAPTEVVEGPVLRIQDDYEVIQAPADFGHYGEGAGLNWWDSSAGRCGRCDSRYCVRECNAGELGWVYAAGFGYVTYAMAHDIEAKWKRAGVAYGPHHAYRRVEWRTRSVRPKAG